MEQFTQAQHWPVERAAHGRHPSRTIDLRQCITEITTGPEQLSFRVEIRPQATARVDEVLAALELGDRPGDVLVTRTAAAYEGELSRQTGKTETNI